MASPKNLRPIEDVVCALFARDTVVAIDPTSDSEDDELPESENDTNFRSSSNVTVVDPNVRRKSNDSDDDVRQPSKKRRSSTAMQSENREIPRQGPQGAAMETTSPSEIWDLLFPTEILDEIVVHTNEELGIRRSATEIFPSYYHDANRDEIRAFIGLLYFSGVHKTKDTSLDEMWSVKLGWTLYRATMSCKRFELLSTSLRFDEKSGRKERRTADKFSPIRRIWESFVDNCKKYYVPHGACTMDEQLISFRGRCPFKMYVTGETEKYGIKIVTLNDPRTFYVCDVVPCVEKNCRNGSKIGKTSVCETNLSDSGNRTNGRNFFWEYTTARKTGRWPMRIWMAMLDLGAMNATILHNFNPRNERMNRPKFLKNLAISLIEAHLRQRMVVPSLRRDLRFVIEKILGIDIPTDYRKTNLLDKKVRCNLCPRGKDRKTRHACYACRRPICDEHRASVCADCCSQE